MNDVWGFIQIAAAGGDNSVVLYALDAGGGVWTYDAGSETWKRLGTARADR